MASGVPRLLMAAACVLVTISIPAEEGRRSFPAPAGGTLLLDLDAGADVQIVGTSGSSISVSHTASCKPECALEFDERGNGLEIGTRFLAGSRVQTSNIRLEIELPRAYDVEVKSVGGDVSISGLEGRFSGKTMGGELRLHDVRGVADLSTMGGEITLTDSDLDGSLETMGGEVLFENVVGDVRGSSMGGKVRFVNVVRRDRQVASPPQVDEDLEERGPDTVQISTMGGEIEVDAAPEGADLHTMGGDIEVTRAERFVRAVTMGGDIEIERVDWVKATTMGGNIDVALAGAGGDVTLISMSGDVVLHVPEGLGMDLDLEIAFTRDSREEYRIDAPGELEQTVSRDWDASRGSPRKYIRYAGRVGGGGHAVKIETINGNITIDHAR